MVNAFDVIRGAIKQEFGGGIVVQDGNCIRYKNQWATVSGQYFDTNSPFLRAVLTWLNLTPVSEREKILELSIAGEWVYNSDTMIWRWKFQSPELALSLGWDGRGSYSRFLDLFNHGGVE